MIQESDHVALGRNAQVTNPAGCFIENFADGKLQTIASSGVANNRERLSIRTPVRCLYVFKNFTRCAASERHSRQSSTRHEVSQKHAVQQHRHFALRRDAQDFGIV